VLRLGAPKVGRPIPGAPLARCHGPWGARIIVDLGHLLLMGLGFILHGLGSMNKGPGCCADVLNAGPIILFLSMKVIGLI